MYVNKETSEYPISEAEIRQSNPNTSYPTPFNPGDRYGLVFKSPYPEFNPVIEQCVEGIPSFISGKYFQTWDVVKKYQTIEEENAAIESHLSALKADKWISIKRIRDDRTQNGGYSAAGKWFHSDTFSRSQQLGLVLMGENIPTDLMWKTMDGSFIEMTQTLANEVFISAGVQDAATFGYAEALKTQVDNSNDPASIDIKSGWPICFLDIE